jgi:beta-1,4-mannosyl-glycoprotein beta-1,4-N-acetylglucosaminyltransferase
MKIYDSFRFFNELELLEIRFNLLYDLVDHFVITECPYTIMGDEKPLYYWENRHLFDKFNDKVIHDVMDDIPSSFENYIEKQKYHTAYGSIDKNCGQPYIDIPIRYQRDMYARDYTAFSIEKAGVSDEDLIITSDADEILNPLILDSVDEWFNPSCHYAALQRSFYYGLNTLFQENWMGSRLCTWGLLKNISVDSLRQMHPESYKIENAGWHWSCFGGSERFKQKLAACADSQHNTPDIVGNVEERIEKGIDPIDRGMLKFVPMDDTYPEYIQNNQDKYSEYIKPWN